MIWAGGWRQRSRCREVTAKTPPREAQRLVLAVILREHPEQMTIAELADELLADQRDLTAALLLVTAARDLTAAGLLHGNGTFVAPTRAAIHSERLELDR